MCLFPSIPRFAPSGLWEPCCSPAAVLGSGHLMETFIPSAPLHHWVASPETHPVFHTLLQLCLQSFGFCIPAPGCPGVGTQGRMLNPKHAGWAHQEGSTCPGGLQQVPLLQGDGACSSASHTKPARLPITYCRDPKITGTVSHASWGLGDAQLLSSGKLNLGLFLGKIINTVVRRADLHFGLCLQTCPVPAGPAPAPATTGSCFWLRRGVLSATHSPTAGFIGKDPPVDMSMILGGIQ